MREKTVHAGIYYGWVVTATTCVMAFLAMGGGSGFGVFVLPMSAEFGWQRGTISLPRPLRRSAVVSASPLWDTCTTAGGQS